ncbi:hypothetical protein ACP4OV_002820 [Aristida adscensionis]
MAEAAMAGAAPPPPLRLKDLLELDCDSCSAAGFRCYPRCLPAAPAPAPAPPAPMRHLLLEPSPTLRRPSGGKLSMSSLSRSLSRRLRGGFWWRRDDDDDPPVATGCGCEPETASESTDSSGRTSTSGSRSGSDSGFSSPSSTECMHAAVATAGERHGLEAMKRGSSSGSEADDKEQLSPVAVMDFPFDDDEDDTGECSPSVDERHDPLERRKMQPQHKIRRFGSPDDLRPVDLDARLAADADAADVVIAQQQLRCGTDEATTAPRPSDDRRGADDEPDEHGLLVLLLADAASAGADAASERLLLDFVVEMRRRRSGLHAEFHVASTGRLLPRKAERLGDGEILAAARGWLDLEGAAGTGRWGLADVLRGGAAVLAEMERGRRWTHVGEEEREVGAVVAGMLADQLVDEVVRDLLV